VTSDRAACLRHLHERQDPFLHSCASGYAETRNREPLRESVFKKPRNLLSGYPAHAAHHEIRFHRKKRAPVSADSGGAAEHSFFFSARKLRILKFNVITRKFKHIVGFKVDFISSLPSSIVYNE
jgi:hypothetical protein